MDGKAKTFPGGKSDLSVAVKGVYTTQVAGYTHNDTVAYANPANIQRANYAWKEHHSGISVTLTELKKDGISVTDSTTSNSVTNHSGRDKTVLVNLFQDKLDDMLEGYSRGMNDLLYGDGTADANALAGIRSIIVDDPTATVQLLVVYLQLQIPGGETEQMLQYPQLQLGKSLSKLCTQKCVS